MVPEDAPTRVRWCTQVTGLEVSFVDHRPQELLVATLDGLMMSWDSGSSGGLAHTQFSAQLANLQVSLAVVVGLLGRVHIQRARAAITRLLLVVAPPGG